MKKTFLSKVASLALAGMMLFTGCGSSDSSSNSNEDNSLKKVKDAGVFYLGLDATFKPMGYTDDQNNIVGFDIDVAEEVCKRMGVKLEKTPINWGTKEVSLDTGTIDCIWNGMSYDEKRAEAMNLSDPYMKNEMVFSVMKSDEITKSDDLKGKKIAVQNGSTAQTLLAESEIGKASEIVALETNIEALQQMEAKLVDAVFLDSIVVNYEIGQGKEYKVLEGNLSSEEYVIGFRKKDQALRDEVQKILSEMKADGKLAEISTKWFGSDVTTVK